MKNLNLPISINSHKEDFILDELNCVFIENKSSKTPGEDVSIELFKYSGIALRETSNLL